MILDQDLLNTGRVLKSLSNWETRQWGWGGYSDFLLPNAHETLNITSFLFTYLHKIYSLLLFVITQARPGLYSDGHTWQNIPERLL